MERFCSADAFLKRHRPVDPVRCWRPAMVDRAASWFQSQFYERLGGRVLYAVKANPSPFVLKRLFAAGITGFDVASLHEIELLSGQLPEADLYYMNPVKSRAHIRAAYFTYGVRRFAVDGLDEVHKILDVTQQAADLHLFVRLACNDTGSVLPLSAKYGAEGADAAALLRLARSKAAQLGVTFHVGSQALVPARYEQALRLVGTLLARAEVAADAVNVGGGFPISYRDEGRVDLDGCGRAIEAGLEALPTALGTGLLVEPGRALVAEAESLIVRVDGRRGEALFINDGGYGVLFDAAFSDWVFPCRLIGRDDAADGQPSELQAFSFWGPTCDAADRMKGPFYLPATVKEGDYIEIYKTGAYGWSMASSFNGFGCYEMIEVEDEVPLPTFSSPSSSLTSAALSSPSPLSPLGGDQLIKAG